VQSVTGRAVDLARYAERHSVSSRGRGPRIGARPTIMASGLGTDLRRRVRLRRLPRPAGATGMSRDRRCALCRHRLDPRVRSDTGRTRGRQRVSWRRPHRPGPDAKRTSRPTTSGPDALASAWAGVPTRRDHDTSSAGVQSAAERHARARRSSDSAPRRERRARRSYDRLRRGGAAAAWRRHRRGARARWASRRVRFTSTASATWRRLFAQRREFSILKEWYAACTPRPDRLPARRRRSAPPAQIDPRPRCRLRRAPRRGTSRAPACKVTANLVIELLQVRNVTVENTSIPALSTSPTVLLALSSCPTPGGV